MEEFSRKGRRNVDSRFKQDIHSNVVRAGKRTYFFDVKYSRTDEYYLTITESKKRFEDDGTPVYEKHKIFLYKEDFAKFSNSLQEVINYIYDHQQFGPDMTDENEEDIVHEKMPESEFTDIRFEDLTF